jgi:hypothetical protein
MAALSRIGAELSFDKTGNPEDWQVLDVERADLGDVTQSKRAAKADAAAIEEARYLVMTQIRRLVTKARLQPRLYWNPESNGQWQIDLDACGGRSNLLAVLTIQLMIRIADREGFAICSICHRSYVPKRRPTPSKRNYCDSAECQRKRWAYLKREQRRRK